MSAIDGFIARWDDGGGTEKANYQLFLTEVIALLGLPSPDPVGDDTELNSYVFERRVDIHKPDGSATCGFVDLYRRGRFVLETKLNRHQFSGRFSAVLDDAARTLPETAAPTLQSVPALR